MSFVSRWTHSISRTGRDSIALSRAVYGAILPGKRSHPTSLATVTNSTVGERIKTAFLQEARREPAPNRLAISFLKIDKEIGLVKYWGLAEYLRQNEFFSFSFWSSRLLKQKEHNNSGGTDNIDLTSTNGNEASETPANSASTARVAFMITSSMKRDLVDGLGYQASVVKGMTPQQASLVLHHRLEPGSYEDHILELETAFEEEQQRQQKELEASAKALEESKTREASKNSIEEVNDHAESLVQSTSSAQGDNPSSPLLLSSSVSHENEESSSSSSSSQLSPPTATLSSLPSSSSDNNHSGAVAPMSGKFESNEDVWYEVVEIKEEGSETNEYRHGLYKDHDEGILGLQTRQDIQRKRDEEAQTNKTNRNEDLSDATPNVTFVLRPVSAKDLQ